MHHTQGQGQSQVPRPSEGLSHCLLVGSTRGVVLDKYAISLCWSVGRRAPPGPGGGTSTKVLHGRQGHPARTKPGAACQSLPALSTEASRAGPCPEPTQSDSRSPINMVSTCFWEGLQPSLASAAVPMSTGASGTASCIHRFFRLAAHLSQGDRYTNINFKVTYLRKRVWNKF